MTGHFVDRDREMQEIEQNLLPAKAPRERKIHILHGMGGIGKTQLAIAHARKHQQTYSAIVWVNGDSRDTVLQSLGTFSRHSGIRSISDPTAKVAQQAPDVEAEAEAVLRWLALKRNQRWLMILDNVDRDVTAEEENAQAYDVTSFLPRADHGSILITSRLPALGEIGTPTEVGRLNSEQALELLRDHSGLQRSNTGTVKVLLVELPNVPITTKWSADMTKLVERLGYLPLALVQAGRYIRETKTSYSKYLELYESSWSRLVAETPRLRDYDNGSIQTTWTISYKRIQETNETAATFLQLWANLDRQDIWYELVSRGSDGCRESGWLQKIAESEIDFKRVMKALLGYSLVESHQYTDSYSVHPVVHDWCAETIGRGLDGLMMTAVKMVGAAVPDHSEAKYWVLQQRLVPHADRCARRIKDSGVLERVESVEASDAFHNLGLLYADQGKLVEAEEMYRRALDGKEKAWGREHTSTLDTVNNLGILYKDQGKLVEAEEMYRRALDGYKKARGPDHPTTLTIANNLYLLESSQGEQEGGKETFQQVLDGDEKAADTDKYSQSLPSSARSIMIRLKAGVRRPKHGAVNRS